MKGKMKIEAASDLCVDMSQMINRALVGRHFHSVKVNGQHKEIEWQGIVISNPQPGFYLCQLFEWMGGSPNVLRLVRIEEMLDWLFYNDAQEMMHSCEYGVAREGGPYRKRIDTTRNTLEKEDE